MKVPPGYQVLLPSSTVPGWYQMVLPVETVVLRGVPGMCDRTDGPCCLLRPASPPLPRLLCLGGGAGARLTTPAQLLPGLQQVVPVRVVLQLLIISGYYRPTWVPVP